MKVICAGAPKTGTKSLAKALRILGYDPVYDVEESIEFAFDEWEAVLDGREQNIDAVLDLYAQAKVEAITDLPHSYFFDKFLERWPDAKVVLMLRNEDAWFESYKKMMDGTNKKRGIAFQLMSLISPSISRVRNHFINGFNMTVGVPYPRPLLLKTWYRRHNAYVRNVVPTKQLLEYDVTQGWEPLCTFLGKPTPQETFPIENTGRAKRNITDRLLEDTTIVKKGMKEIRNRLFILFAIICVMIAYFCML